MNDNIALQVRDLHVQIETDTATWTSSMASASISARERPWASWESPAAARA